MNPPGTLFAATLVAAVSAMPLPAEGGAAYALPVTGLTVDGDLSDWPSGLVEYPIATTGAMHGGQSDLLGQNLLSSPDLSASFRVGYDREEDLVYVAVQVRDDVLVSATGWTNTDACEVYVGGGGGVRQYFLVPGGGEYVQGGGNPGILHGEFARTRARAAWKRSAGVTTYEWAVEAFGKVGSPVDLEPGLRLSFDLAVADRDRADDAPAWVTWGPYGVQKFNSASRVGSLVLLEEGVSLASLTGTVALTGLTVHARDGSREAGAAPVRGDGSFEMLLPPGEYELTLDDDYVKAGAMPVSARAGGAGAPVSIQAAFYRAQPPKPKAQITGSGSSSGDGPSDSAYQERRKWEKTMETLIWVVLLAGLFTFLTVRQVLQTRTRQAAIQAGQPIPEPPRSDPRKMALILIALGLGFALAMGTTLGLIPDPDAPPPMAVAVWGLVPVLLGGALWLYRHLSGTASS